MTEAFPILPDHVAIAAQQNKHRGMRRMITRERADLIFVYAGYSLRYLYLLVLTPFYGRVLGVEGYAQVLAAMSLMNMVWLFVGWGFLPAGGRSIATSERGGYGSIFWQHFGARSLLAVLAVAGGVIACMISPIFSSAPLIGLFAVLLGITSAYNLGWYFTGSQRPRYAVMLEITGFMLSIVPILIFVRGPEDAETVLSCLLFSSIISLLLAHWLVRKEVIPVQKSIRKGYALIRSSSTLFIYSCSSAILVASSTFLLSLLADETEVGHFGAAERLVSVGLSIMGPAGQIFIPRITALFVKDEAAAYQAIRKATALLLSVGFGGLVFSLACGAWVIPLIFGQGFEGSVPILQILAFVFPLAAHNLILGSYVLIPQHRERSLTRLTLLGAALNLAIAIPASLAWGATGMAVARVAGEAAVSILLIIVTWHMGILSKLFSFRQQGQS